MYNIGRLGGLTGTRNPPERGVLSQATTRVLFASLIGTTVEFYDFYIYATAASLVFGPLFFPSSMGSAELVSAYASFGIAFLARPLGGAMFGHFGDRIGRKATLVASLILMGVSTAAIGLLPVYAVAGWLAPFLLCLLRFGQGLALGGEWTGAALLALENAPPGWRARFAMFAPLGAPTGFILANGLYLTLTISLTSEQFAEWGWRIPFIASAPLIWLGLWVRLSLLEPREFVDALRADRPHRVPLLELLRTQMGRVLAGTFGVVACFSLYYTATAFTLGYGTTVLGYDKSVFLMVELGAIVFMAIGIVIASWLSDRLDPSRVLICGCVGTVISGIILPSTLHSGSLLVIFLFLAFALLVMGFVNGPLGAWLPSLFPPRVRYTGTSVAFNVGGILGGAFSPVISQLLAERSGLMAVGFYLAVMGGISLVAFDVTARKTTLGALAQSELRYRSIFEQTHVALCEMDFSVLDQKLRLLKAAGVPDIEAYCLHHPTFVAKAAAMVTLVNANIAASRLLGVSNRSDRLEPSYRIVPGKAAIVLPMLVTMFEGGSRFETQAKLTALDGQDVIVILAITFPDPKQPMDRVAVALVDVTEREQAKETLLAAQAELARAGRVSTVGAVSASIAHEINQPIGAMVMSAQACVRWLNREMPEIGPARAAAERAVRDALRASDIVQRTREQVRSKCRRLEPVELAQVIGDVLPLLEQEIGQARAFIRTEIAPSRTLVVADRVEMRQVLVNLLTNAIHAVRMMPEGRREVMITVDPRATGLVRLSVRDTGPGFREELLDTMFRPFFTTKVDGMGMGLAICKTIIEAHGGTLRGKNVKSGGAEFEVSLPEFARA